MTKDSEDKKANLLIDWLEKPYYLNQGLLFKILLSLGTGIFTTLFLIIIKPHYILENSSDIINHSIFIGCIVTLVLLFYFYIIQNIFKNYFNPEKWNIGKHAFVILLLFLFCCISFWIYLNSSLNKYYISNISFKKVVFLSLYDGFLPLIIYIFVDERISTYKLKKLKGKKLGFENRNIKKEISNNLTISSYNKKDKIDVNINNLVYISSESNYASFFIAENNKLKEIILRKSLSNIEEDFLEYDNVIRIHKSYIINSNYITNIRGNAKGFFLSLDLYDKEIPVSRKFSREKLEEIFS